MPKQHRRDALDQEQPLPAAQAELRMVEQQARHGPADHARDRGGRHEERDGARPVLRREPVRQVQDDAGEEPRLAGAEQEAQRVERPGRLHEHHAGGDESPEDHDAGDPQPRADLLEDDVARHLEEEVADEEDAGARTSRRCR